jgi:ribonuclease HII
VAVTLRLERTLLRDLPPGSLLAAVDEVGRGALAGPVAVGVVVIDSSTCTAPRGVRDSKECDPATRERLAPRIRGWALRCAVGMASAREVDDIGIIGALALAAVRAVNAAGVQPHVVLLDGKHDWMSRVAPAAQVVTRIQADGSCASVAAASIVAKVARDRLMVALDERHPGYGWAANKGYAAPDHIEALERLGPSPLHRVSWRLPGVSSTTAG